MGLPARDKDVVLIFFIQKSNAVYYLTMPKLSTSHFHSTNFSSKAARSTLSSFKIVFLNFSGNFPSKDPFFLPVKL
ncbi:hypothetical protein MTR67_046337 [Solanum verrucosum]|uniref:Uncharacterized protein n=1 Tax=Solanum verrucosum TaxID=315347 RepID=A0AAF0ZUH4_SOLVR|nr:hypothetical protein MTR67_046337 [Solanum verrucosum]